MSGFSIDTPIGGIGFSSNDDMIQAQNTNAYLDRKLQSEQWNKAFNFAVDQDAYNVRWNARLRDESLNKLTNMAMDARRAGISPLAALGAAGATPANFSSSSAPPPSGRGPLPSGQSDVMKVAIEADALKKLAEAFKTTEEAKAVRNESPNGQIQTTRYGRMEYQEVPVAGSHIEPGLSAAMKYQRGPGGTRIPVSNADVEEIIAGWMIQKFGRYQANLTPHPDQRYRFMSPERLDKYYPDRTNRFNPDMDIAP